MMPHIEGVAKESNMSKTVKAEAAFCAASEAKRAAKLAAANEAARESYWAYEEAEAVAAEKAAWDRTLEAFARVMAGGTVATHGR